MPFNLIHLRNLTGLAEAGATIAAHFGLVHRPDSLDEMVDFLVVRLFDGLEDDLAPLNRWNGPLE